MGAACGKGSPALPEEKPKARTAGGTAVGQKPPAQNRKGSSHSQPGAGHSHLILKHAGNIGDVYELGEKKIGEGAFGSVRLGSHKVTGTVRAIKSVPKGSQKNYELLTKEIATMKAMDHPHIIQLFETFEDRRCVYFAMELCGGGELFDRIAEQHHFSERDAAIVMQQVLQSINYLHGRHIAHRDLKPENFLFLTKDPIEGNLLKLIDFGLACPSPPGKFLKTKLGTVYYMAPQVLMGRYCKMCDIWSVGVMMYILLSGKPPFHGQTDQETFAKIREGIVNLHGSIWSQISPDAKSLVKMLLKYSPQARSTADQALEHDWILHLAPNASEKCLDSGVVERLRAFKNQNQLKKAALEIAATQLDDGQIKTLRESFKLLDANGDGKLSMAELTEGLEQSGLDLPGLDVKGIVANMDGDGSGAVDYTEFLAAALDKKAALTEEVLWTSFNVFDQNGDGKISPEELKICLDSPDVTKVVTAQRVAQLLKDVDLDGDGFINFAEFVALVRGAPDVAAEEGPGGAAPRGGA